MALKHGRLSSGGIVMLCRRCEGLMEIVYVRYLMEDAFHSEVATTRCINCGNIEDAVIRSNRTISQDIGPRTMGTDKLNLSSDSLSWILPRIGGFTKRARTPRFPVATHSTEAQVREKTYIITFPRPNQRTKKCT